MCDDDCTQPPKEVSFGFNDDFYWSSTLQGVAFGDIENAYALDSPTQSSYYAIFDSGSPHLTMPYYIFDKIIEQLKIVSGEQVFFTKEGVTFVDCFQVG